MIFNLVSIECLAYNYTNKRTVAWSRQDQDKSESLFNWEGVLQWPGLSSEFRELKNKTKLD